MIKDIKINGTKLEIKSLIWRSGDSKISDVDKKSLKYQMILFTGNNGEGSYWKSLSIAGKFGDITVPDSIKTGGYTEALVLVKASIESNYEKEAYDFPSQFILRAWIGDLCDKYIDTAELLCHALRDNQVAKRFYESYGMTGLKHFKEELSNSIKSSSCLKRETWTGEFSKIYARNRYNIVELVDDLIKSGASIYTDAELIGSYKKISRSVKDGSSFIPGRWSKIVGKAGNRTRANLSLTYLGQVTVDVPENEFGEPTGPRELNAIRSFCIVADGLLNMKKLGIKTSDKKLIKKLKAAGVWECNMVMEDEYLLDLTKIPIIRKCKARYVDLASLASTEAVIKEYGIMLSYLRRMKYKTDEKLTTLPIKLEKTEVDPREQFLHGLGIYGDTYYPPKTEVDKVTTTYESVEVIGNIKGLPSDPTSQVTKFINTGKCSNPRVQKILEELKGRVTTDWVKAIEETENKRDESIKALRDMKFNIIMSKNLRFNKEPCKPRVEDIQFTKDGVTVSWDIKTTEIDV